METSAPAVTAVLDLNRMQDEPRLCIKKVIGSVKMVATDKYLLYFPLNRISILNEDGEEQWTIHRDLGPRDLCWSSYLNRFLVLTYDKVYLLDVMDTSNLPSYEFTRGMWSCTCYGETLLVKPSIGSFLEEYSLSSWKLIRTHKPPVSCSKNQDIHSIRFNSTGTHLGLIICATEDCHYKYYFALHNWKDQMQLVQPVIDLDLLSSNFYPNFLSLHNQQFLVYSTHNQLTLHLINDSTGELIESIDLSYYDTKLASSMAFINGDGDKKTAVIRTGKELRFHNL
jgi:hypothetical protein